MIGRLCRVVRGDGLDWIVLLVIAAASIALVRLATGCRRDKPPAAPRVILERRACIDSPPPDPIPVVSATKEQGCPDLFAICLVKPDAARLIRNLEEVYRYARKAFTRCGPLPASPVPGGPR